EHTRLVAAFLMVDAGPDEHPVSRGGVEDRTRDGLVGGVPWARVRAAVAHQPDAGGGRTCQKEGGNQSERPGAHVHPCAIRHAGPRSTPPLGGLSSPPNGEQPCAHPERPKAAATAGRAQSQRRHFRASVLEPMVLPKWAIASTSSTSRSGITPAHRYGVGHGCTPPCRPSAHPVPSRPA